MPDQGLQDGAGTNLLQKRRARERQRGKEAPCIPRTPGSPPRLAVSNPRPQNSSLTLIQWDSYFILLK